MRVLLTGAGGQLGHDLVEALSQHELDARDRAQLDITDRQSVLDAVRLARPDWIVNAAAYTAVDAAEGDVEAAFAANELGPSHLAWAAATTGAALLHVSTDYVFDGRKATPYLEGDEPNPLNVYGLSKYGGEHRVLDMGERTCLVRTAGVYGRHGKNFVKTIAERAARKMPLRVVRDQVTSPTSSRDLAQAIAELVQAEARGVFHIANAGSCSWFEFAQAIVKGAVEITPIAAAELNQPARRPAQSALTSERLNAVGVRRLRPWQEALQEFLSA